MYAYNPVIIQTEKCVSPHRQPGLFTMRCNSFTCTKSNLLNFFPQAWDFTSTHVVTMGFLAKRLSTRLHMCLCVRAEIALVCQVSPKCWVRQQISTWKTPQIPNAHWSTALFWALNAPKWTLLTMPNAHITSCWLTYATCNEGTEEA